jgi:hypothetical protein
MTRYPYTVTLNRSVILPYLWHEYRTKAGLPAFDKDISKEYNPGVYGLTSIDAATRFYNACNAAYPEEQVAFLSSPNRVKGNST